jgi:spermidine/putrescine transport system substrate-binding protein
MKNKKYLGFAALFLILAPSMMGCSSAGGDAITLRVLNWEDYIADDILNSDFAAFKEAEKKKTGKVVNVIYDTFDTNETMMSSLQTGKAEYDLIAPSDYTIQKMMSKGMLHKYTKANLPNYTTYGSKYLLGELDNISAAVPQSDGGSKEESVGDYACGYMWGTLGVLFNPAKVAADKGLSVDQVKYDLADWNELWNSKYHGEMSIKDSMRDTYSVGIMKHFDSEVISDMTSSGIFDDANNLKDGFVFNDGKFTDSKIGAYNAKLTDIFNRCDETTVNEVKTELLNLKNNVFGFEVDSGKDDMVKGLVGINLAWSGDAVYSMNQAENEKGNYLYYSIPKTGGNIWFDGWVMPTTKAENYSYAEDFVDYLSSPEVAAENVNTIGYSCFIAGNYIQNTLREWYDPRSFAMYVWHDASKDDGSTWEDSDFVRDDEGNPVLKDGTGVHEDTGDDYGSLDMSGSTYEKPVVAKDGAAVASVTDWASYQTYYNSLQESEDSKIAWTISDLTYIFENTLTDDSGAIVPQSGSTPDANGYLFFTDATETIADPDGKGADITVGRQFLAQYPTTQMLPKLAIMKDYGTNNKYVLAMWQSVKANNLPYWGVIVFALIIIAAILFIGSDLIIKHYNKKIRIERRKETSASMNETSEK